MTTEQLIEKYVSAHADCRWMDAGELHELLTAFAKDLGWHSVEESLPEIEEEVIVLTNDVRGRILPTASRLCFAHRPNPDGYYAKSTLTGKKTHYTAETYDGWNIPGVKYWMPCPELPEDAR